MHKFDLPETILDELLLALTQGTTIYSPQNQKNYSIEKLFRSITS